jgi:hypothetical protein
MSSPPTSPKGAAPDFVLKVEPQEDEGRRLYRAFIRELLRRVESPELASSLTAAELELIRKVASDNSITIASIRRGDFGDTAKRAAEEFPFPEGPQAPTAIQ